MHAELLLDVRQQHGESAHWCEYTQALYWTDIEAARLWRYQVQSGATQSWPMPERLAAFSLCDDPGRILLGLASRLAIFDLRTGRIDRLADIEPDLPTTRVNDGRSDRDGRFVFGTMDEAAHPQAIGSYYRLNPDLSVERLPLGPVAISNSVAFSPDGRTLYYCDSPSRRIMCCDYPAGPALPARTRVFTSLDDAPSEVQGDTQGEAQSRTSNSTSSGASDDLPRAAQGVPDGSTVDAEGNLWNAHWGAGCIVCYSPDGRARQRVSVPSTHASCVSFGGPDFTTLYITTARKGMSSAALSRQPYAGGVFAVRPGGRGLPGGRFRLGA